MSIKKETPTNGFNGQGNMIIFDEVADYSTATLDSITKDGFSVGQVFEGSTSWNGEDPSFEDVLDEQGDVIFSTAQAGTYGWDFNMADLAADKLTTFLKAKKVTVTKTDSNVLATGSEVSAWGDKLPIITRPIALFNDELNKVMFFPKAKILSGVVLDDKHFALKSIVKAQPCDTANLGTCMLIDKAELVLADA